MEIVVHSKNSVFIKVSKAIVPFQQGCLTWECDVNNDSIGLLESGKKSDCTKKPGLRNLATCFEKACG